MYLNPVAARGMGALPMMGNRRVIPVPQMVPRRNPRGLYLVNRRGMGDCSPMPGVSYSNINGAVCRDNATGNIVACSAVSCSAPAAVSTSWAPTGPTFIPTPVIQSIPVGGFTGTLPVPTLASRLGDLLAAKESPFNANLIASGAVNPTTDAQDFGAVALEHCTEYAASQGCDNPQAVAAQFVAQYVAWLKTQSAAAYHAGDVGSLAAPNQPVGVAVNRDPIPVTLPLPVVVTPQSPAPAAPAPSPSSSTVSPSGSPAASSSAQSFTDLLNKTFSIAGYNVPVWEAGLAVIGGALLFGGKH